VAEHEGHIYVDLARDDGLVVKVEPDGYRLITDPPVRFIRGSRGPLPLPEAGGTLADFQRHFNLSAQDVVRVVAFMIGTFNVYGSYPLLFILGEQGSAKSTLADLILALIDPPKGVKSARFSFTRDEKDLHVAAKGARVLCFDNISHLSAPEADALCRMATGAASSGRKLYTDDEETRIVVVRPVIATAIGLPSARGDLLSRSIVVRTLPVTARRSEEAVMEAFDRDQRKLLGFLLDCASAALKNRTAVRDAVKRGEISLPRMGDFGQFVEGASDLLGLKRGEFSTILQGEQGDLQVDAAQTHPVGSALLQFFSAADAKPIRGPAREVLALIRPSATSDRVWPAPGKLRNELTRIAEGLRKLGIEFQASAPGGRDHVINYQIWTTSAFRPEAPRRSAATGYPF
jgi:hypothetical protein